MTKLFGLPILAALGAGIAFPYTAIILMPYGFAFLFILMLLSGFSIDWHKIPAAIKRPAALLVGLFFLFVFFPLLQLFLAKMLITDAQFLIGIVFGSLMPVALVAPFFTNILGDDEELAFLLMVCSTLLAPFVAPLLLKLYTAAVLPINAAPLFRYMLLLVTMPLLCSYLISRLLPQVRQAVMPYIAAGNMTALSLLIFILFGTAVSHLNIGYESSADIVKLVLLAFVQDFGVLFLARFLAGRIFPGREAGAIMVSLSMKNVAIAAGVLLFYDPRASLAPALVFIAHACLFTFIPNMKGFLIIKK